ncbi:MAG: hypothetical protein HY699_07980 [Deltaproteobacteria bacterium]|nr:hypothetical protein [Deltaproteobacteria bacterium]
MSESTGAAQAHNFDEYLWPLVDEVWPMDWDRLTAEHRLRLRLREILAHVQETHVAPRLRRLGAAATVAAAAHITQQVISGPPQGEYWERTLHGPVPRALCDEWAELAGQLRRCCLDASAAAPGRPR